MNFKDFISVEVIGDNISFKKEAFNSFTVPFKLEIDALKRYINECQSSFKLSQTTRMEEIMAQSKRIAPKIEEEALRIMDLGDDHEVAWSIARGEIENGLDEYLDLQIYELDRFEEYIIDNINKSGLLLAYGFLESKLKEFCSFCKEKIDTNVSVEDIAGGRDYLKKSQTYLDLVIDLGFKKNDKNEIQDSTFSKIEKYQNIRNRIVHYNSLLVLNDKNTKKNKNFKNFIKNTNSEILIRKNKLVIKKEKFIIDFLDLISDYFDYLFVMLEKKLDYPNIRAEIAGLFVEESDINLSKIEFISQNIE